MPKEDEWLLVGECPINSDFPRPIEISNHEVVVALETTDDWGDCSDSKIQNNLSGLWFYDVLSNCWSHKIKYDETQIKTVNFHNITYNENTKDIYLYGSDPPLIKINTVSQKQSVYHQVFSMRCIDPVIVCDNNNNIHLIGGSITTEHHIWNPALSNVSKLIYTFEEQYDGNSLVYLKKQNKLILLGGYDHDKDLRQNAIFIYDISTCAWTKSKTVLPNKMNSFGCVLTKNEKYVIILFGYNGFKWINEIYILNISTMQFIKSKIKAPFGTDFSYAGSPHAFGTDEPFKDDLLIIGYIKMTNVDILIPKEIVAVILSFCSKEYIHILYCPSADKTIQYKISVGTILKSY